MNAGLKFSLEVLRRRPTVEDVREGDEESLDVITEGLFSLGPETKMAEFFVLGVDEYREKGKESGKISHINSIFLLRGGENK